MTHRDQLPSNRPGERGAVLVYVAVALIGLMAFSALVIDMGVMWVGRRQVQNAADAGALSGAISLAFRMPPTDPENQTDPAYVQAKQDAGAVAIANRAWGVAPRVVVDTSSWLAGDVQIIDCPEPIPGILDKCVRVNAYRNQEGGGTVAAPNLPLPTFFARLVGVEEQGARATATAQVFAGVSSSCIKPWAIPDLWYDRYDTVLPTVDPAEEAMPTLDDTFDYRYQSGGDRGAYYPSPYDLYVPDQNTGSGYSARLARSLANPATNPTMLGRFIILKAGNPHDAMQPGWFFPIVLPEPEGPSEGGDRYRENIANCNGAELDITTNFAFTETEPGNMIGPTRQGVEDLIAQDQESSLDCTYNGGQPGWTCEMFDRCGQGQSTCNSMGHSPRWVAVPIFDPAQYIDLDLNGRFELNLKNLVGVWLDGLYGDLSPDLQAELRAQNGGYTPNNQDVIGRFWYQPAVRPSRNGPATFLRTVVLIR